MMDDIQMSSSSEDELLQLQRTLDLLTKDQDKMEAGVIKLHNRNRNIHEIDVEYDSKMRNEYLKETRSKGVLPGPGEYVYKSSFGSTIGGKMNPLPKKKNNNIFDNNNEKNSNNNNENNNNKSMIDSKGIERGYKATKKRVTGISFGQRSKKPSFLSEKDEFNLIVKSFFGTAKRNDIGKVLIVSKLGDKILHPDTNYDHITLKGSVEKAHPSSVFSVTFLGKHVTFKASRGRHLNCSSKIVKCERMAANRHGSEFLIEKVDNMKKYCRLQSEFGLYLTAKSDGKIVCEALIDETDIEFDGKSSQWFYSVPYTSDSNSYNINDDLIKPRIIRGNVLFGTPKSKINTTPSNKIFNSTEGIPKTPKTTKAKDKASSSFLVLDQTKGYDHVERKAPVAKFGTSSRFGTSKKANGDAFESLRGEKLLNWFQNSRERKVYLKLKNGKKYLKPKQPGPLKIVEKENVDQECVISFCHIEGNEFALRNIHRDYITCHVADQSTMETDEDDDNSEIVIKKDKDSDENEIGFLMETKGMRIALKSVKNESYLSVKEQKISSSKKKSDAVYFTPVPYAPIYNPNDSITRPTIQTGKWTTPTNKSRKKKQSSIVENSPALSSNSDSIGLETPSIGAPTPGGNISLMDGGDEPMDVEPNVANRITPQRGTPNDSITRPRVLGGAWGPAPSTDDIDKQRHKRKRENTVPGPGAYSIESGIKKLTEKSTSTIIAPPAVKRTKNQARALRQHRKNLRREQNTAGPGMYDVDRASEVLRHGPNAFAEKERPTFSRSSRGIIEDQTKRKQKNKAKKEYSLEESKYSEDYLRNEEIIADNEAWKDGEISAMLQKPDLNASYVKPRVKGGAWTHKSKKSTWKNYHALKKARREKEKLKSIGHYDVKHDKVEKGVTGVPLLEQEVKSRKATKKKVKKATLNRKLKEHFEEAIRTYVDDMPEKGEFLDTQLHDDWAKKETNKPVFQYREEEPLTSPVARLKKERERELRGPENFIGDQSLINWKEQAAKRDNGLQSSLLDMSKHKGRDVVKVKRPGVYKVEKFHDPPKLGTDSFGPGHYENVDEQYEALIRRKPGSKAYVSFAKGIGRKEAFGPFGDKPEVVLDEDKQLEIEFGIGGDGEIIDLEPPVNRPNQKDNTKSFTWSKLPRDPSKEKDGEAQELILEPDMDWGKKGRDVIKPTAKLKYEPFSRQTGRPVDVKKGGGDADQEYGDGYDMDDYGMEGDIVDIDPRLTPLERRVKTAKISSKPRWKTEIVSQDMYDHEGEEGRNLILSPKEDPRKERRDRHTVDFTKQKPRWAADEIDFDMEGDMAFAPSDNASNVVYDVDRGHDALNGDKSKGNVGVSWNTQKPRFTPKQKRDALMDDYAGDSPKLILSPKEHGQSTVKPVKQGVAMSKSRPRWEPKDTIAVDDFELPNEGEGLILRPTEEREAFQQPRVQSATTLEKSRPRWTPKVDRSNVNDIDHSDIKDGEALILEPTRKGIEKREAPTAKMKQQRGRSEPVGNERNKVDTSDLVYSPNVDFGRKNNQPMVRSVREVQRQRKKELENKMDMMDDLSKEERKKMRRDLKQKFLKENLRKKMTEPWSKKPLKSSSSSTNSLKNKKDDINGLNVGMEELIISPNTAKEKLNAKTKRGINMLKQGISRSEMNNTTTDYDGGIDNIPRSVKIDNKEYINDKPKTPTNKEKFMMKEDLTGTIAPVKKTFARKVPKNQKPPKPAGRLKSKVKLSNTLIGGIRKTKKKKKKKDLSKTIAPIQKTKAEIVRDQMLNLQFENDDEDWD